MNRIDSYQFGKIVINGQEFTSDLIIFPDRLQSNWWRKKGHELAPEDIIEVFNESPEILVVGTGDSGLMRVLTETENKAEDANIRIIAQNTTAACDTYNQLSPTQKVIAALHLTC